MVNTTQLMTWACEMAGFSSVPGDSRIYNPGEGIKRILFGVDISTAELKTAKDMGFDAVIAHHPPMTPSIPAWEVYARHIDIMVNAGVPEQAARAAVEPRIETMKAGFASANHDHYPSIARLLNMPFMNIHCPLDELGRKAMQDAVDAQLAKNPDSSLQEVANAINALPEFATAFTKIEIAMGEADKRAGKVVVAHGALTNGGYAIADTYYRHGVDTVIYIHIGYPDLQKLRSEHKGNLIITGHIVSDLVGINPYVRLLREKGLEVVTISGITI